MRATVRSFSNGKHTVHSRLTDLVVLDGDVGAPLRRNWKDNQSASFVVHVVLVLLLFGEASASA